MYYTAAHRPGVGEAGRPRRPEEGPVEEVLAGSTKLLLPLSLSLLVVVVVVVVVAAVVVVVVVVVYVV